MKKIEDLIPLFRPNYDNEEVEAVKKVLLSGWIGLGPKTEEFEEKFADYVDAKYAIALNSATSALHLALIAANIQEGDEVIAPALTFVSTIHVIDYVNATPVFADLNPKTLCISPEDVEKKITDKTKAIIVVHYGGHPADMDELIKIADKNNITIIEDAAHACGSSYKGNNIGSISPLTCFSFHAVKNLATGDGGMITTDDKDIADRLKKLRWMGINKSTWGRIDEVMGEDAKQKQYGWYYEVEELGFKYHMNDINAALGLVQLNKLEKVNKIRRKIADKYTKALSKLEGIGTPIVKDNVTTSQHNYAIRFDKRDEFHLYAREWNISTGVHYLPIHLHPYYRERYKNTKLPVTESEWKKLLLLPIYPELTTKQQDYIIDKVEKFMTS